MEKFREVQRLIAESEENFIKFYEKNNKAAGTRARKAMQDLKNLAQEIRKDIQEKKNEG